jgi:hypothetical protein
LQASRGGSKIGKTCQYGMYKCAYGIVMMQFI